MINYYNNNNNKFIVIISVLMASPFSSNTANKTNPNFKKYLQFSPFEGKSAANARKNTYKKHHTTHLSQYYTAIYTINYNR